MKTMETITQERATELDAEVTAEQITAILAELAEYCPDRAQAIGRVDRYIERLESDIAHRDEHPEEHYRAEGGEVVGL